MTKNNYVVKVIPTYKKDRKMAKEMETFLNRYLHWLCFASQPPKEWYGKGIADDFNQSYGGTD
jgi:phage terminase large subunit-like protein